MKQHVAVLVDGDNISGKHAAQILSIAAERGDTSICRVYTDAQRPSDWHGAIGYRMFHAGTGKNAADILLALDAMELAIVKNVSCFVIASSDGDFTHLAARLREYGAMVIGVGEAKATRAFRGCCNEFMELGISKPMHLVPKRSEAIAMLDQKIREMISVHSKKGAGMRMAELASKMGSEHGVKIGTYPEKNWRSYLLARPSLYDVGPRGPEAMVRFRQEGFAEAA
ncbi:uncharacterized protein (TIGR00288 family) [Sulfitobacter undariae]|uniref:Uncharacterized protein (TIGR00288 family) n=1 Tax=Sulfitobacter undariae TaxID=1563671 RepID=A0A7W6E9M1_9RHOB|nr:uncharacterized protein (TIGR00288 family) [Sulfitobacter undariae]